MYNLTENNQKSTLTTRELIIVYARIWLFYIINCLLYGRDTTEYMILGLTIGIIILSSLYITLSRKFDFYNTCTYLLIVVLPVSFRSIFCTGYDMIPVPWFYIILLIQFVYLMANKYRFQIGFALAIVLLLIPLLLSHNLVEGFKEYLGYASFCIAGMVAYTHKSSVSKIPHEYMTQLYINGILFVSIGVIIQYIALNLFDVRLFRIGSFANSRRLLYFLFYDMSGITVYMGTGVILLLFSKIRFRVLLSLSISVAMALSSTRAGVVTLLIVIALIVCFENKRNTNKIGIISFLLISSFGMVAILLTTRKTYLSFSDMITSDNGRNKLVLNSLNAFFKSPIFGRGLDLGDQLLKDGSMVAHNAIINLLAQSGIIITSVFVIELFRCLVITRKHYNKGMFWCCVNSIIGSCVSPGFFNLRFFSVIYIMSLVCMDNLQCQKTYE